MYVTTRLISRAALVLLSAASLSVAAAADDIDWDIAVDGDVQAECHGLYAAMATAAETEGTAKDVVRFAALRDHAEKKALELYAEAGVDPATAKKNVEMQRGFYTKKYKDVYAGTGGLAKAEEDAKKGCEKKKP